MSGLVTEPVRIRPPRPPSKLMGRVLFGVLVLAAALAGAFCGLVFVYSTDLPEVVDLEHYRPSATTELYDDQGRIIGSFALQRRIVVGYNDFPKVLRDAIISTEDREFFSHWGVNFWRIAGAAWRDLLTGRKAQGASTLTMQLSRNLFLTPERTFRRKAEEVMLALQIERHFTKQQIFTMYCNQIFLGHGAYGFEAGAEFYFSKHARDLTLPEAAMLAGLPKAPNYYSPLNNPKRALLRRNLVIDNMLEDGKITAEQATLAKQTPLRLNIAPAPNSLAPYYVEEVRRYLERKYGSDRVHQSGLRVYTSLDMDLQAAANQALLDGLAAYERRHGWRGSLPNILTEGLKLNAYTDPDWSGLLAPGAYVHALVTDVSKSSAVVKFGPYQAVLGPADIAWTRHKSPQDILTVGDLAYVKIISLAPAASAGMPAQAHVSLEQDSGAQAALVAIDNATGDVKAMIGGRDFNISKFNRATQALRQVGSSFKPYVYTAAIDNGASPDDMIYDGPVTFQTASGPYTPHDYEKKFHGNVTLRQALAESLNIPALELTERLTIPRVIDYARRFGITSNLQPYLPIALGADEISLVEHTAAFTTFPDDGVRVVPRYIRKVDNFDGHLLEEDYPEVDDVVSPRTARIMVSMLRDVVQHGTGYQASKLKYPLGGKTGTTNNFTDAWFVGFSPSITCGVWVGFDDKSRSLGDRETGAAVALPIWMNFMQAAMKGHENEQFPGTEAQPASAPPHLDTADIARGNGQSH